MEIMTWGEWWFGIVGLLLPIHSQVPGLALHPCGSYGVGQSMGVGTFGVHPEVGRIGRTKADP